MSNKVTRTKKVYIPKKKTGPMAGVSGVRPPKHGFDNRTAEQHIRLVMHLCRMSNFHQGCWYYNPTTITNPHEKWVPKSQRRKKRSQNKHQ